MPKKTKQKLHTVMHTVDNDTKMHVSTVNMKVEWSHYILSKLHRVPK